MTRIVSALVLLATVVGTAVPAFAITEVPNCNAAPQSDWARCVIRQSQQGGE